MFSHYFIERPIFASVLSIIITLAGAIAAFNLPIAQYPQITPPSIIVTCNYPGANAQVVAESVAAPIEQQVNGVEDMIYMSSQSANDGSYSLTVTFKPGVNLSFAQVLVQNRVNLALPLMPDVVKQAGITTRKRNPDMLLIVSIFSRDEKSSQLDISNFVTMKLKDEIARVDGVGDVIQFGQRDYSMRIWLDPDRLASLNLSAMDVTDALREQNKQVASGHLAQQPLSNSRLFEYTLTTVGRLSEVSEFEDIIIKADKTGRRILLRDVAKIELGPRNEDINAKVDGYPATSIVVFQLPYANSIATAKRVEQKMEELKLRFPEGVEYVVGFDTSPYIQESIREVFYSLFEAILLVALVVLVFLQNWRSSLIPLAAVPVAIIGTFAVMALIGFTLNNLTLFGLVLAIGIVVDDAIVVVESIEHHIEEGMTPRQAAHQAMEEVSGPVIAVALVLSAVFIPCAFISGITGQFFRQFALTIAVSTLISAFNSLTLSPALAALLLQPRGARKDWLGRGLDFGLGWFFSIFNICFRRSTQGYTKLVSLALRGSLLVLIIYTALVCMTGYLSTILPTGYIPTQDQGKLFVAIQLPDAASLERTQKIVNRIAEIVQQMPGVSHVTAVTGQSFTLGANGSNFGNLFISLDDFKDRRDPALSSDAIAADLRVRLDDEIIGAATSVFGPPAVAGLGSSGGFKIIVEDRSSDWSPARLALLEKQTHRLVASGKPDPKDPATLLPDSPQSKVANLFAVFRANTPQLYVDLNREQCETMGVDPRDVFTTLQTYLGSYYVNDFNRFGRTWQVIVQARGEFRNDPDRIKLLQVRNQRGKMVPLGAVLSVQEIGGPILISRYNMYPAAVVVGATKPGVSSSQGIEAVEQLCRENLTNSMSYEWTEINFIQIEAANYIWNRLIFPLAVVLVFMVLAALYESWALPLAVILVVPMCILSSLIGVYLTHTDINIFTQIGFVVLVGLASKNAILIVEYAKHKRENGISRRDATLESCKLRLRPILMTSFAFILGAVPLLISVGAGAEMRRSLGIAVFSGMLGVTLFGIFLTPVFFHVIEGLIETPLFSSVRAKQLGYALWMFFGIITLGLFWLPGVFTHLRRKMPQRASPTPIQPARDVFLMVEDLHASQAIKARKDQPPQPVSENSSDSAPQELIDR